MPRTCEKNDRTTIRGLLSPLVFYGFGAAGYLALLTAAALRECSETTVPTTTPQRLFSFLIPAHNEEHTLPHLLESIENLAYPPHRRQVVIVADNCTDATALIARRAGATVLERHDQTRIGKGYALDFGISWILEQPGDPNDAILILDADSEIDASCLLWLNDAFSTGAVALQSYYTVTAPSSSTPAALRYLALSLYHYVRPLGRKRLGLSAGLRGNGMAFTRACLARVPWQAHGLTEDVEQHMLFLKQGIRVDFVPQAIVRAEMPSTFQVAASQNRRWERGRLLLARQSPRLIWESIRRRHPMLIEAAIEQLVAPLSICSGLILFSSILSFLTQSRLLRLLSIASVASLLFHVVAGLRLAHVPPALSRSLLRLPLYMTWKWWIWLQAALRPVAIWQRTQRHGEGHS
ncbi:MAG: glycosyltransferase family 2 protein [Chloroflexi bacterium]|nr:glycosyltransferase family 2 protein [Chloroflexota bacterium]